MLPIANLVATGDFKAGAALLAAPDRDLFFHSAAAIYFEGFHAVIMVAAVVSFLGSASIFILVGPAKANPIRTSDR
jgi:hypothetical protein